jgi:lysophospholipase L1-like esterase
MGLEWQEDESYVGEYDGKNIRYHEVSSPPDIVDSSITMLDEYDSDIVFFKLCFVDFGEEQGDRLAEDEQYIQQIYNEVVTKRHRKLIVGNALPQVSMYTTSGMKSNHKAYNQWLSQFASTHSDIQVLDLYGMLSDSSGNLKAGYAVSSDDSHLNDAAYAKITPAFMDAIGNAD